MPSRTLSQFPLFLAGLVTCLISTFTPLLLNSYLADGPIDAILPLILMRGPFLVFLVLGAICLRRPPQVVWGLRAAIPCAVILLISEGFMQFYFSLYISEDVFERYFDLYHTFERVNLVAGVAYAASLLLFCGAFVRSPYRPLRICAVIAAAGRAAAMVLVLADSLIFDLTYDLGASGDPYFYFTQCLSSLANLSLAAVFIGLLLWLYHERLAE